jgi:hypothetical protein
MRNHDYWVYILTNKHCRASKGTHGGLDLSDDREQQPKFYDYPWDTDEMI